MATQDQVRLSSDPVHPRPLVLAQAVGHDLATAQCQQAHSIGGLPRHDPLVVGNCSMRPKARPDRLVAFVRLADLGDGSNRHLGAEPEAVPDLAIDEALNPNLVGGLLPEGDLGDPIAGRIEPLHGLEQRGVLVGRRSELDGKRQLHALNDNSCATSTSDSSPWLKPGASSEVAW